MTDDPSHLLDVLARELSRVALGQWWTAEDVVHGALGAIPHADAVSLALRVHRGRLVTIEATDPVAVALDEAQHVLAQGPCLDAISGSEWSRSGDVEADGRWPRWGAQAAAAGIRSALSITLVADGATVGALNLYSRSTDGFARSADLDLAVIYVTDAALAMRMPTEPDGLRTTMHARHLVSAAQGVLVERYGLDLHRTFDLLQRCAALTGDSVVDIATAIVEAGRPPAAARPGAAPGAP